MNFDVVANLLSQQEEQANILHSLLSNELEILKTRELSALEKKSAEKELCLTRINQIDNEIKQHASIEELRNNEHFAEQVNRILNVFEQCKEQNEINGQIINNSQVAINRFKGMLQESIANNSMTYDKKGKTNIKSRSIGLKA